MKTLLLFLALLCGFCLSANAANPSFQDFNTNQYGVAGNKVSVASGALLTNINVKGYFVVNTNNLVVTNGNVGVGIATPLTKIHSLKTTLWNSADSFNIALADAANSNKFVGIGYDAVLDRGVIQAMHRGTTFDKQLLLNPNAGNVGVGTTNPVNKLEVRGSAAVDGLRVSHVGDNYPSIDFVRTGGSSFSNRTWRFIMGSGGEYIIQDEPTSANFLAIKPSGDYYYGRSYGAFAPFFFITNTTGFVGIGTATPTAKLDVFGGELRFNTDTTGYGRAYADGGGATYSSVKRTYLTGGAGFSVYLRTAGQGTYIHDFALANDSAAGLVDVNSGQMRFTATGLMGIGTTNPLAPLHVQGSALLLQNTGAVSLTINDSLNANIPIIKLQQGGATRAQIEAGVGLANGLFFSSASTRVASFGYGNVGQFSVGRGYVALAGPVDGMIIEGNVGIGTATPSTALEVVGAVTASSIVKATNGFASYSSNGLAAATVTIGASPSSFTNTLTKNIVVYVDGLGVVGSLGINGATVFSNIQDNTIILQPGDYMTFTYASGLPTAVWRPF